VNGFINELQEILLAFFMPDKEVGEVLAMISQPDELSLLSVLLLRQCGRQGITLEFEGFNGGVENRYRPMSGCDFFKRHV